MATVIAEKLAVHGGTPVRTKTWPDWPIWDESDVEAVADVVRSGKWNASGGRAVAEFGAYFSKLHNAKYAVPCTNGTHALEIAYRAAGIKAGHEVITTPYTFMATASAIVAVNGVPIFADVDPDTMNIDPKSIESMITEKTKAIVAVHIAGCPADMDGIMELARKHNLVVIEDSAQAHLAEWKGRRVGAIGTAGTFSFQASKNLNAGEGGIVITDEEEVFENAWSLCNCGRVRNGGWYEHRMLSGNYRMPEFCGAMLLSQARRLEEQTRRRNENAAYVNKALSEIEGIRPPVRDARVTQHAYHILMFRYDSSAFNGMSRMDFVAAMRAEGMPCSPGYTPLYRSPAFRIDTEAFPYAAGIDYTKVHLPEVEKACEEMIWMGQSTFLAEKSDLDDIPAAIRKIQAASRS